MLEPYLKPVLSKQRAVTLALWGEAGIGKSFAVANTLKHLPCQHLSLHATTSLPTLGNMLSKPKKLPLWAEITLEKTKQGKAVDTSDFISALSRSLSGLTPFVLHLEDAHEASPERLGFLNDLAQSIQKLKGVGLLVTSRQELSSTFKAVKLEPLTKEASDKLLEQDLGASLPREALEFVYSKAAGNPLFTLEYRRFLARQGYLWNDGKLWHWRKPEQEQMPAVVEALLEQQILQAKATELNRYVLESKAILPLDANDALWQQVARVNSEELNRAVRDLNQRGILKGKSFAHPLFKEVTVQTLSKDRRKYLARRAIHALEDDPIQAALFVDDAELSNEQSLELLKKAADSREQNNLQKANMLAKAAKIALGEEKGRLSLEAAILYGDVDITRCYALATQARSHLTDPAEAIYQQARALTIQGKTEEMLKLIPELNKAFERNPNWTKKQITLLWDAAQYQEIIDLWERQIPSQQHIDSWVATRVAESYISVGKLNIGNQLIETWLANPDLTPKDITILLESQVSILYSQGDYKNAEMLLNQCLELSKKNNAHDHDIANLLRNRVVIQLQLGHYQDGIPNLQKASSIYQNIGFMKEYALTLIMMSYIYYELDDLESNEAVLLEALDILHRSAVHPYMMHVLAQLTSHYASKPNYAFMAQKYALDAIHVAQQLANPVSSLLGKYVLVQAEFAAKKFTEALGKIDEVLDSAKQIGIFESVINASYTKGLILKALGQTDKASTVFSFALESAQQNGMVVEVHKIALELACLNNDLESAREHMQWFNERGLMKGVNIAKRYFPELDQSIASPSSSSTTNSPRLEVLSSMQIHVNGNLERIKGGKRKACLTLLVEAHLSGRTEVKTLEFFDALYSDENEYDAANNLRGLIKTLRELLGDSAIVTTVGGYALGTLQSDAELFLQTGDTSLWRGVYLEDTDLEPHETVAESLYLLLYSQAKERLESDPKEVARVGKMLLEVDPYNQDYLKLCLEAFRASSNHKSLKRLYTEAKRRFTEVGETLPEGWQAFLNS